MNQYVKRSGTRQSRQCVDGSKKSANILHVLTVADSYSSCVDQPIKLLFLAISAILIHKIFGGDATNAYAHSPGDFTTPTFVSIDEQHFEWHEARYKKKLNRSIVLPILKAIQGHPESGCLTTWSAHHTSHQWYHKLQ